MSSLKHTPLGIYLGMVMDGFYIWMRGLFCRHPDKWYSPTLKISGCEKCGKTWKREH